MKRIIPSCFLTTSCAAAIFFTVRAQATTTAVPVPKRTTHSLLKACSNGFERTSASRRIKSPSNIAFTWRASLNETTGIASAKETSSFITKCSHDPNNIAQVAEKLLSSYLSWLVRPSVTLGVLREAATGVAVAGDETTTAIQLKLCRTRSGCANLLCFGPRRLKKFTLSSCPQQKTVTTVTTNFPIRGGLFALDSDDRRVSSKQQKDDIMGALCMKLLLENDGRLRDNNGSSTIITIQTELIGYRPWLAGRAPIHPLRKLTYLSTQSIVHAYVMWRFHRHVVHQIIVAANH